MSLFLSAWVMVYAAAAPQPRIAIVDLDGPQTMVGMTFQITGMIVKAANDQKLTLITPAQVREKLDDKSFAELRKCSGRPGCVSSYLSGIGADRAIVGSLGRDEDSYLVKIYYIDLKTLNVIADIDRSILIASRRLQRDVELALPALLRGEKEAKGKLTLTSNVPRATVTLNGEPAGETPLTLELKPGKYKIHVEKKAYMSVDRFVSVEANSSSTEVIRLVLGVGQTPEEEKLPPLGTGGPAQAERPQGIPISTRTWIAGGATVVTAGLAGMFGGFSAAATKSLKQGYDPTTNTYMGTRKEALRAVSDARTANILFAVAGAGAIVTGLFVYWDITATDAPPVKVSAAVVPGAAQVSVGGSF